MFPILSAVCLEMSPSPMALARLGRPRLQNTKCYRQPSPPQKEKTKTYKQIPGINRSSRSRMGIGTSSAPAWAETNVIHLNGHLPTCISTNFFTRSPKLRQKAHKWWSLVAGDSPWSGSQSSHFFAFVAFTPRRPSALNQHTRIYILMYTLSKTKDLKWTPRCKLTRYCFGLST